MSHGSFLVGLLLQDINLLCVSEYVCVCVWAVRVTASPSSSICFPFLVFGLMKDMLVIVTTDRNNLGGIRFCVFCCFEEYMKQAHVPPQLFQKTNKITVRSSINLTQRVRDREGSED